jgi:hypothetical protein
MMKNALLLCAIAMLALAGTASAQTIITENGKDTAIGSYTGGSTFNVVNGIRSGSSSDVWLRWNVIGSATNFGPGWDISGSGVCDNINCRFPGGPDGNIFLNNFQYKSDAYTNAAFPLGGAENTLHDFHVQFGANNPPNGSSAVVRVNAYDTVSQTSRTLTFIAYKGSLGVTNFSSSDDVVIYPNPAHEVVNVLYDAKAGVKTIAVYNLIGKLVGPIYRPTSTTSAHLELNDMPTGVYFLRLMDGQGRVVATRRFTRQ